LTTDSDPIEFKTRWGIVLITVIAGVVAALQVGKVPPVLPVLRSEMGLNLVTAGWVASIFNTCGALLGVAIGLIADRMSARPVLYLCLALTGIGSLIGSIATSVAILLLSRIIEGIGFVGVVVAAPAIITAASSSKNRTLTLSIWSIYMPVGMAAAMAMTPVILQPVGWRGVWVINVVVIAIILLILSWFIAPRRWSDATGGGGGHRSWYDVRQTLSSAGPWLLGGCFTLYSLQFFAVMTWLPTFLIESQGRAATGAALISATVVFANVLGNLTVPWLIRRGVERWKLIGIAFLVMAMTAFGIFSQMVPGIMKVSMAFTFSAFGGLLPASILASAPMHSPSQLQVATTNGIIVQGSNCGSLAGPPVMATAIGILGGWHHTYWLMIMCSCIGIGLVVCLKWVERKKSLQFI
jgi:MFS family permease